jgi:hypothetical protein
MRGWFGVLEANKSQKPQSIFVDLSARLIA